MDGVRFCLPTSMDPYEDSGHEIHPFDMTEEEEDEELPARVKYAVILQEEAFEDEDEDDLIFFAT